MSADMFQRWFLDTEERGNRWTGIDRLATAGAWTVGNDVTVLVDGRSYFPALLEELRRTESADWIYLADLQSDGEELLDGPGTEVGSVLASAALRGASVRGLLWRSHPIGHAAAQVTNLSLARTVNDAGGEVVLDHRVRWRGSHHQKLVVIHRWSLQTSDEDVAFVGGIDLAHGRNDGPPHRGDPQPTHLADNRYGSRPPWHDVQLRVRGPAVRQMSWTFRERWLDPSPLDKPTPARTLRNLISHEAPDRGALASLDRLPTARGTHAVQVLRTYPERRPPYPFAANGERSIARAYIKAFDNAKDLIYLEDQYLWSLDATAALCAALRRSPDLVCVIVIPRYPDPSGVLGAASRFGRWRVEEALASAGGDRVAVYDLENEDGTPVYVHAKVCIVDDTWMTVGSDNLNRRSWTHDSELCCAVMDEERALARETRLALAREHLDLYDGMDADLADTRTWFDALRQSARDLNEWHEGGCVGRRPRGRLRVHARDRIASVAKPVLHGLHAVILDPDGRPRALRSRGSY